MSVHGPQRHSQLKDSVITRLNGLHIMLHKPLSNNKVEVLNRMALQCVITRKSGKSIIANRPWLSNSSISHIMNITDSSESGAGPQVS